MKKTKEERRAWFYSLSIEDREKWINKKRESKKHNGVTKMLIGVTEPKVIGVSRPDNILPWD